MNKLTRYLQSIRQHSIPKMHAFERKLDAIRETHASVTTNLEKLAEDPAAIAADLFPREAESKPGVFQNQYQQPRTVADVYRRFDRKFNTGHYGEGIPG